ncbi:MAG: hypothetical protein ACWA5A_09350 [Marinibacterium sp.]
MTAQSPPFVVFNFGAQDRPVSPVIGSANGRTEGSDNDADAVMAAHLAHAVPLGRGQAATGTASDPARPGRLDPHRVHREFPERWRDYIRAHYGTNYARIMQEFHVSERTARKWCNGEGGCNGGNVAIAVERHPDTAPRMLFAAE